MAGRNNPPIGTPCNLWGNIVTNGAGSTITAAATGVNGVSNSIDTLNSPFVSIFGNVNGATTLNLQYSADNVNFNTAHSLTASGAGDFNFDVICGAQYMRLQSTNNVQAYATGQAKGGGG
jgi:hypothetical protein